MRPQLSRGLWSRRIAAGSLALAIPSSLTALAVAAPDRHTASDRGAAAPAAATAVDVAAPSLRLNDRTVRFGEPVVARGRVAPAARAVGVTLQYAPTGGRWRTVKRARPRADGRYRIAAELRRSGKVRVRAETSPAVAAASQASRAATVAVAGKLVVPRRGLHLAAGSAAHLRGVLFPRARGSKVTVEGRVGSRWRAVGRARTKANGHFAARVVAPTVGSVPLRVRSASTAANRATKAAAGRLNGYRAAVASWYWLYGDPVACGGTLGYHQHGVAHKTLPCGTKVTVRYRGKSVTVPVIDRGPYVSGREWDLTGATARALGFTGVGTVWTTR